MDNRTNGKEVSQLGGTNYLVNNSFFGMIQPKRASFDIKIYLQLHRKLIRRNVIEKKFEESLYHFNNKIAPRQKGFKGQIRH